MRSHYNTITFYCQVNNIRLISLLDIVYAKNNIPFISYQLIKPYNKTPKKRGFKFIYFLFCQFHFYSRYILIII